MKKAFFFIALLSLTVSVFSQELTIKSSFREDPNDLSALTNQMFDYNDVLCALVKVGLEDPSATFSGTVVKSNYNRGEWWVYMREGSKRLEIKARNNATKVIDFDALEGGITYKVGLALSSSYNNNNQQYANHTSNNTISNDDLEQITSEIRKKVTTFQRYLNNLAGKSFSREQKEARYQLALELFIGKGDPYEIIVPSRNGDYTQMHEAVKMGIFPSKNSKKRVYQSMKDYLTKLINNNKYKEIVIESSEAIRIDNFREAGNGRYIALAHYLQKYSGYSSSDMSKVTYSDYTSKTVTIYINRIEVDMPDGSEGHYWQVLLGDVDCDDVW